MRHWKAFTLPVLGVVLLFGGIAIRRLTTYAVTDTCSFSGVDVPTEFNATYPATVQQGDTFTISGLSSKPSNSYGVTVYKSNLALSATNSSPVSYSKNNTSTNPNPTTGQTTYTAYYPSWSLKATGAVGGSIVVKLVSATATIDNGSGGQVDIPCNLSETIATIKITAKSTTIKPVENKNDEDEKPAEESPDVINKESEENKKVEDKKDEEVKTDQPQDTENESVIEVPGGIMNQLRNVDVLVKDSRGNPAQGAKVTIGGQLTVETDNSGLAKFENIRLGEHNLKVVLGGTTLEQTLRVSEDQSRNSITVTLPTRINTLLIGLAGAGLMLLVSFAFVVRKFLAGRRTKHIISDTHEQSIGQPPVFTQSIQPKVEQQFTQPDVQTAGATGPSETVHSEENILVDQPPSDKIA